MVNSYTFASIYKQSFHLTKPLDHFSYETLMQNKYSSFGTSQWIEKIFLCSLGC